MLKGSDQFDPKVVRKTRESSPSFARTDKPGGLSYGAVGGWVAGVVVYSTQIRTFESVLAVKRGYGPNVWNRGVYTSK